MRLPRIAKLKGQWRGDTLIEVLVAITVISLILTGGYIVSNTSTNSVVSSSEHSLAIEIGTTQLDSLRSLISSSNIIFNSSSGAATQGAVSYTTFCIGGGNGQTLEPSTNCNFNSSGWISGVATPPYYSVSMKQHSANSNQIDISISWQQLGNSTANNLGFSYRVPISGSAIANIVQPVCQSGYDLVGQTCVETCAHHYPGTPGINSGDYPNCSCTGNYTGTPPNCTQICAPQTLPAYTYVGNTVQSFTVPSGCTRLTLTVYGAAGGTLSGQYESCYYVCSIVSWNFPGGNGGGATTTLQIGNSPGQIPSGTVLSIYVGQQGGTGDCGTVGGWGYATGGDSCTNGMMGGGASAVTWGGTVLALGGGGGGAGGYQSYGSAGGAGGGLNGSQGGSDQYGDPGGYGGTQTAGGTEPYVSPPTGQGTQTSGGTSQYQYCFYYYWYYCGSPTTVGGGGGGGGWWGGGAGYASGSTSTYYGGGGGGGSSYVNPNYYSNVNYFTGTQTGNGQVVISYQ